MLSCMHRQRLVQLRLANAPAKFLRQEMGSDAAKPPQPTCSCARSTESPACVVLYLAPSLPGRISAPRPRATWLRAGSWAKMQVRGFNCEPFAAKSILGNLCESHRTPRPIIASDDEGQGAALKSTLSQRSKQSCVQHICHKRVLLVRYCSQGNVRISPIALRCSLMFQLSYS